MSDYMRVWDSLSKPPKEALKTISAGRLKGMTDVSPQWRIKTTTEQFGRIGEGWYYEIFKTWTEQGAMGEVMCFVHVHLFIKDGEGWSMPIVGIGGSALIAKESSGLRANDEAYKMALTDALSVAMKQLGVASAIYEGLWDGSKYKETDTITSAGKELRELLLSCENFRDFLDAWAKGDNDEKQKISIHNTYKAKYKTFTKLDRIKGCNTESELSKHITGVLTEEEQDAFNMKLDSLRNIYKLE